MIDSASLRSAGIFGKPVGYKGSICLHTDEDIVTDSFIFLMPDGLPVPYRVTDVRIKGEDLVVTLKGIDGEKAAANFTGKEVYTDAPPAESDDDTIYLSDLKGFRLHNTGNELGTITYVDDSTENVLFFVETPDGKEIIVPAAEELMTDIDTKNRILTMDLPEELINLNN